MYRCPECGSIFEDPDHETICMEEIYGVGDLFGDRHHKTIAYCPDCGDPIDTELDTYDEDDEGIVYYERQGDEYVFYDSNDRELYREPV